MTEDQHQDSPSRPSSIMRKSAARLAAVQVLFQLDLFPETADEPDAETENSDTVRLVESAIRDLTMQIHEHAYDGDEQEEGLGIDPDPKFLTRLACGTAAHLHVIDALIVTHLSRDWRFERLDPVLRATLRCAAYELLYVPSTPTRVILNEYVDVTAAFSEKLETGFVNGILEAMAKDARQDSAPAAS